jgi:peptidoglycan/xylan/chitin deacetylase (PgdA/CDA1 family)
VLPILALVAGFWLWTQTAEPVLHLVLALAVVTAAVLALRPVRAPVGVLPLAVVLGVGAWVGANSAELTWFGHQVSHGPRGGDEVALTFDDGPDIDATLAIARILDAHGAKGTFFEVGKAVIARPDITRTLLADGHLVGNHSYRHDSRGWLDPRYPELAETQHVFARHFGVCPAFYRAPHGQHTPFLAHVVSSHGMTMVGWDVSVGDWTSQSGASIARRVLRHVEPGSIIDLHDGLDGDVHADRSNLVDAMPLILRGLEARGLHAVRLDELLDRAGYLTNCSS